MPDGAKQPATICHVEIPAPDLQKARAFYGSVFRRTFEPSGDYLMFSAGEGKLGGGFSPTEQPQEGGVLLYLRVEDIPAALEAIKAAGGSVVRDKTGIGEWGFYALVKDTNGTRLGLWSPT